MSSTVPLSNFELKPISIVYLIVPRVTSIVPKQEEEKKLKRPAWKINYAQNYKVSWEKQEEFFGWLGSSTKGSTYFKCNVCLKDFKGGIAAVKKHSNSSVHERNITAKKVPSVH